MRTGGVRTGDSTGPESNARANTGTRSADLPTMDQVRALRAARGKTAKTTT